MKRLLIVIALLFATAIPVHAVEVGGATFDETAQVGGTALKLNGAGIRTRFMFKVYAMGLYLTDKQVNPVTTLALPGAKRIQIVMLRDVGAEKLVEALDEGIRKNQGEREMAALQARVDEMKAAMLAQKEMTKGMVIVLDWLPASGTHLTINGQAHRRDIPGEDFYLALMRVWLGDHPVQDDLKANLLGRPE